MAQPQRRNATARAAQPGVTGRFRWLVAVGLAALACFTVATLPASLIAGFVQRSGLSATEYSGSLWSGVARDVSLRGATLGELRWRARPLALLRGRIAADLALARPDGSVSATVAAGFGEAVELSDLRLDVPLEFLAQLAPGMARDWHGRALGTFAGIRLVAGWPVEARGELDLLGLAMPALRGAAIGSYHLVVPDPQTASAGSASVTARAADKGGPLAVDALLTLAPGRSFRFEGTVAPRADASPDLARALEILGPADAAGRREFGMSGTF
jgi:general secretion pathway protein N